MPKFGQAEFAEFLVEMFMKNKLDKILESTEKKNLSSRNTEDIYRKFLSSKDAAYGELMC